MTVEEARAEILKRADQVDIITAPAAAGCWKIQAEQLLSMFQTAKPREAVGVIFERGFTMGIEYALAADKVDPFQDEETLCRNWSCWNTLIEDFIERAEVEKYDLDKHVSDDN